VAAQWAVGWWQLVVRYSFLLQELFAVLARQKIALKNKLLWFGVHPSRRYSTGAKNRFLDRVPKLKKGAGKTWQRTEILLPVLHHWK
jgi:hypothetical protein